jgi:hypothetical protein
LVSAKLEKKIWLELEDSPRVCLEHILQTSQPSDWAQLSQPYALHIQAKFVDTTEILIDFSTQCRTFGLGLLQGTFHWSVPQNNPTDLIVQFASQEYEIVCIETASTWTYPPNLHYLVVERHPEFHFRVGVADISGRPVLGEERLVRLR